MLDMVEMWEPAPVPLNFNPVSEDDWLRALADPYWRIYSGRLYKIMTKDDEYQPSSVVPFIPNGPQCQFLKNMHHRNLILKARQLGFTTLISILYIDHAMFIANQRCGIIAHSLNDAEVIFRDKVKFAYNNLPEILRQRMPLTKDSASELLFAHNNSSVRVATSMRSGTIHRLHVSEMGKISAEKPAKAKEIVVGSLPAVPTTGIVIIESTAEGAGGEFHKQSTRAEKLAKSGKFLNKSDFKFHFFAWWRNPEYVAEPSHVTISPVEHEYFDKIEGEENTMLTIGQRAWYVSNRDAEFAGDQEKMWHEYPSTSKECWQKSTEGTYYPVQMARMRKEKRICRVPYVTNVPVNSFWDIGARDGTAIWLHQQIGLEQRFIGYIEGWSEPYAHFVTKMQEKGYVWGQHYLPHDADHERQQAHVVTTTRKMLEEIVPTWNFEIVPVVPNIQVGIDLTRGKFAECWFDETECKEGLEHLDAYHKTWNSTAAAWTDTPYKLDGHSEAADAFRQFAQGYNPSTVRAGARAHRRRGANV